MKLAQMKHTNEGGQRWTIAIADKKGRKDYELAIRGPEALVSRVFEKSDSEIEIDPHASTETAQKRFGELREKYSATAKTPVVDDGKDPFKKPSLKIDEKTSVSPYPRRGHVLGCPPSYVVRFRAAPTCSSFFRPSSPAMARFIRCPAIRTCSSRSTARWHRW